MIPENPNIKQELVAKSKQQFFEIWNKRARLIYCNEEDVDEYKSLAEKAKLKVIVNPENCLLYTSPSPRDLSTSRMPSSA